jgi:hypothetical protein
LSFDVEKAPDNIQLKYIDLQSDDGLKKKCLFFELLCDSKYSSFYKCGKMILSVFAPIYNSEQTFSLVKLKFSDLRAQMTDKHLVAVFPLQCQHLHETLEDFSATISSTICYINLVSTYNEFCNLESYPYLLIFKICVVVVVLLLLLPPPPPPVKY